LGKKRRRASFVEAQDASATTNKGKGIELAVLAVSLIGVAISGLLTHFHQRLHAEPGWESFCAISPRVSCDTVLLSRYSTLGQVPISAFAFSLYLAVAVLAVLALRTRSSNISRSAMALIFLVGAATSLISAVLASVSAFLIRAFCPLCAGLYVVSVAILTLSFVFARHDGGALGFLRRQLSLWRTHSEWPLLAIFTLAFAFLITPMAFPPARKLGPHCGPLGTGLGDISQSPLRLVVYSDFQCSHCRDADHILRRLRDDSRLIVVHRQYPLDNACNPDLKNTFHLGSCLQARAAICAERLGYGQAYSDRLFDNSATAPAELVGLAKSVGMDERSFAGCLDSNESKQRLDEDLAAAAHDHVRATPPFVADERRYVGALDPDELACVLGRIP